MANYFQNCKTLNEVKATYKALAKEFHPDLSETDTTAIMQEINKQYTQAISKAARSENFTEAEVNEEILNAESYKNIINAIINRNDIVVELVGLWLWVTPVNDADFWTLWPDMKKEGLFFAKVKRKFYFRSPEH